VITFDENANITSIYDKEFDREVIKEGTKANQLEAFEDLPYQYDNWELSEYYKQKKWNVDDLQSIEKITDGARSGFKIIRKFLNSVIEQKVWVYENSRRIDFETDIDWKESHIVLKAAFPINVHADKASYETQFGYVERPTHGNTSWDAARFEVCAHKWADLSEYGYGVSLLNDCKYGYSIEDNVMKLSLLKAATYPYPEADRGHHTFTYSLLPHTGGFREGLVVQEGYKLNMPLMVRQINMQDGVMPQSWSLIHAEQENIVIETIKKSEDDESVIVRFHEAYNQKCYAHITTGFDFREVYLVDLMEKNPVILPHNGRTVVLPVQNYELITLQFVR